MNDTPSMGMTERSGEFKYAVEVECVGLQPLAAALDTVLQDDQRYWCCAYIATSLLQKAADLYAADGPDWFYEPA